MTQVAPELFDPVNPILWKRNGATRIVRTATPSGILLIGFGAIDDMNGDTCSFLNGITDIDYGLLRTIKSMTTHLEVGRCSINDWQRAILEGFAVWREVMRDKGGRVLIDLDERKIVYLGPAVQQISVPQVIQ